MAWSHPAVIHGVEDRALIIELVEGETLAERIAYGKLPLEEALPIAVQIAEGLEYAHEHGVVHRDLKPANIKITPEGRVKILDFGLAKALGAETSAAELENSPTLTHSPTLPGVILGTAAYMAPEQAKGKAVDWRADIWAFGCVLFELLSGRQAFRGETATEVLAAVIMQEPDWSALPAPTPSAVRKMLEQCLRKDPKRRLQAIGDARIALEETAAPDVSAAAERAPGRNRWPWMAATAVLAIVAAALLWTRPTVPAPQPLRFRVAPPEGGSLGYGLALSPDGARLLFAASDGKGKRSLWLRRMDGLGASALPGTEEGQFPFWAPDGASFGFFADGALKRYDLATASVRTLCGVAAGSARGGSWSRSGVIVFSPDVTGPLMEVPADGGTPTPATELALGQASQRWPYFLPDGHHFLFDAEVSGFGSGAVGVGSLGTKKTRALFPVTSGDTEAIYASGYLLYARGNALVAQKFDAARLRVESAPVPVTLGMAAVGFSGPTGYVAVSASASGLLAYDGGGGATSQLEIMDPAGKLVRTVGLPGDYATPAVSPDGKRVAVSTPAPSVAGESDLWLVDIASGARSRFTFDTADNSGPVWSPDGRWIYYTSDASGRFAIYRKAADGSQPAALVYSSGGLDAAESMSHDGRILLFDITGSTGSSGGIEVWWLPVGPEPQAAVGKPVPYLRNPWRQLDSSLAPDNRWIAYESNADGNGGMEVYVSSFPYHAGQWQVSSGGGYWPSWSADGRTIYFMSGGHLMATTVTMGTAPEFSPPRTLFAVNQPEDPTESNSGFSLIDSGRQILINQIVGSRPQPITLVKEWPRTLPK